MKSRFAKIGAVVVILLVAILIYSVTASPAPEEVSFERTDFTTDTQSQSEAQDLLRMLQNLKNLRLEGTLFANQAFIRLADFSRPLEPQEPGRANPFAPLGVAGVRSASSTTR